MKYLCLDIGNVICHVNLDPFVNQISCDFNVSLADANRFLKSFQRTLDLGLTTVEDELKNQFGVKSEVIIGRLVETWNESVSICTPIIDQLNALIKEQDLQISLLSNIGPEHVARIGWQLGWGDFYRHTVQHFSCQVGARKPSKIYYQSFLSQYPQFQGALYVDDLRENLKASEQFGFQTFHLSLAEKDCDAKIRELVELITNS